MLGHLKNNYNNNFFLLYIWMKLSSSTSRLSLKYVCLPSGAELPPLFLASHLFSLSHTFIAQSYPMMGCGAVGVAATAFYMPLGTRPAERDKRRQTSHPSLQW